MLNHFFFLKKKTLFLLRIMKDCKWNAAWCLGCSLLLLFLRQVEKYAEIVKLTGHFTAKVKNLTLMCKQDTLSYKLSLECFSLESSLREVVYQGNLHSHLHCWTITKQLKKTGKTPFRGCWPHGCKEPAMLYLKKQSNSSQLACCGCFLWTVYYHANIPLFPIFA